MWVQCPRRPEEGIGSLVKEVVSNLKWVLRTELRSPARANAHSYPLKFSPAPGCTVLFNTPVGVLRQMKVSDPLSL